MNLKCDDGIRYKKWKAGGLVTNYYLDGSTIIAEKNSQNTIIYKHDENGRYVGFNLNGTDYYYAYNAQGDVMGIVNASGTIVAYYIYDAWGKVLEVRDSNYLPVTSSTHVGNINPIRYRGYYYDAETGLYYLNSRYYDPTVGRFVNADAYVFTGLDADGLNMYAYCENDPINMADYTGYCYGYANDPNLNSRNSGVPYGYNCGSYGRHVRNPRVGTTNATNAGSTHDANRRPSKGEPGSTYRAPNGDTRTYGPDGNPEHDYDHSDHGNPKAHPHDANGGHNHDWVNGVRGPAYDIGWEPVLGTVIITACVLGIVVVAIDDATVVGVADDFLFAPLGAGIGEGFIMIFGGA